MMKRIAVIRENGDVMVGVAGASKEYFIGLMSQLRDIEIIGKSFFLRFEKGSNLWAEEIRRGEWLT